MRDQVVKAATQAFADRGFRGASLDSIAAAVGITRQGLLHYFPNKTELLMAVLDQRDQDDLKWGAQFAAEHRGTLAEGLQALLHRAHEDPALARLFTVVVAESVDPEHPAHEHFRDRYHRTREFWAAALARAQDDGHLDPRLNPEALAVALPALLDGLHVQRLLDPSVDIFAALDEVLSLIAPVRDAPAGLTGED